MITLMRTKAEVASLQRLCMLEGLPSSWFIPQLLLTWTHFYLVPFSWTPITSVILPHFLEGPQKGHLVPLRHGLPFQGFYYFNTDRLFFSHYSVLVFGVGRFFSTWPTSTDLELNRPDLGRFSTEIDLFTKSRKTYYTYVRKIEEK